MSEEIPTPAEVYIRFGEVNDAAKTWEDADTGLSERVYPLVDESVDTDDKLKDLVNTLREQMMKSKKQGLTPKQFSDVMLQAFHDVFGDEGEPHQSE